MAITMILSSCASSRVQELAKTTQETLAELKKEAQRAIDVGQVNGLKTNTEAPDKDRTF